MCSCLIMRRLPRSRYCSGVPGVKRNATGSGSSGMPLNVLFPQEFALNHFALQYCEVVQYKKASKDIYQDLWQKVVSLVWCGEGFLCGVTDDAADLSSDH